MTPNELLEYIFSHLALKGSVIFSNDIVKNWPNNIMNLLINSGIMQRIHPAKSIECHGCEENCFMPIDILPSNGKQTAQAFISCDKDDDIGLIFIDVNKLEQWQITNELIIWFINKQLSFNQGNLKLIGDKQYHIGVLAGKKHKSAVLFITRENMLYLSLAGYTIPLTEIFNIQTNQLCLDKKKLLRLVDDPVGINETPEKRRERLRERVQQEKMKGTRAFNKVIAKEEGISISRLKQILEDTPSFKNHP